MKVNVPATENVYGLSFEADAIQIMWFEIEERDEQLLIRLLPCGPYRLAVLPSGKDEIILSTLRNEE